MSEDCLFCSIVAGDIPSRTVYEDEEVFAFLDVNPLARGHTLVIPKAHHERVGDLPPETAAAMGEAVARLTPAVEDSMDAEATTVAVNNGEAAGQDVDHTHCHIVPRTGGDGAGALHTMFGRTLEFDEDEMDRVLEEIGAAL